MKTLFNLTTSEEDLQRFEQGISLPEMLKDFDGVELMYCGEDQRKVISKDQVVGLHMSYFPFWMDFWKGNEHRLLQEFDTRENWESYYGGGDPQTLVRHFQKDLAYAHRYEAEYVVFHVSECTIEESFTWNYHYDAKEVIDETARLLNEVFRDEDGKLVLLLENLWQPGLTFTEPELTRRLLEKIEYPNKGIMLDTGHLLHMNTGLKTQEEGISYIHQMLDAHGDLAKAVRGIHLNQSLTGEYCEKMKKNPPKMEDTFEKRCVQMFFHAFAVDLHQPFTGKGVKELVERINPEYLNFELITENQEQHTKYLTQQLKALGRKIS